MIYLDHVETAHDHILDILWDYTIEGYDFWEEVIDRLTDIRDFVLDQENEM